MTLCIGGVADGEWVHDDRTHPLWTVPERHPPLSEPTYAEYVSAKAAGFIRHSVYRLMHLRADGHEIPLRIEASLSNAQALQALVRFYNPSEPR